jgi:hypothetical protein
MSEHLGVIFMVAVANTTSKAPAQTGGFSPA